MTSPARLQRGLAAFAQAQQFHTAGRLAEAAAAYNRALADIPNHPAVLAAFARLAEQAQDWKNAETLWRRLAAVKPDPAVTLRIVLTLGRLERHEEALALLDTLAQAAGSEAEVPVLRAMALAHLGRWEESLASARESWQRREDVRAMEAIVVALYQLARADELDRVAGDVLARFPDSWKIRSVYGLHALKSFGDLARAFTFFADIRRNTTGDTPAYDTDAAGLPWDGRPFDGTLRVVTDAGIGDQVLAASMFAELEATGQHTQVLCDARLLPVFRRSFPRLAFLPRDREGQAAALATFDPARDRRANALDLGRFWRRTRADFPARTASLAVDTARRDAIAAAYRARWPDKRLVGISWHSSRVMEGGAAKGLPLAGLLPLLRRDDCVFFNLQYGNVDAEIAALHDTHGIELHRDPAVDPTADIDGLLAQIAALDAVVTTSNTTAHLAGAVGAHCLVLLPASRPVLWYWGYTGERTPWYPSCRLLRCPEPGGWAALVERIAGEPAWLGAAPGSAAGATLGTAPRTAD